MSILEDGPLRRILRERRLLSPQERPEDIVRQWREEYDERVIKMAVKMADKWLKGVTK